MNWKLCVTDPQRRALKLCDGSMDEGDGYGCGGGYCDGNGNGGGYDWGNGNGYGNGDGEGYGWGNGYGRADGDGYGSGYGDWTNGDGFSSKEWK